MLAALRRRRAQARRRPAQRHGLSDKVEMPELRMLDRLSDAEMLDLRIGEDLIDRVDRSTRHPGAIEDIDPRGAVALRRIVLDRGVERIAVVGTRVVGGVAGIGPELGRAERFAKPAEMRIARGGDVDVAVARAKDAGWNARRMGVAGLRRDLAGDRPARGLEIEHGDLALKERGLHPLPLPRLLAPEQGAEDADGAAQSGRQIGDRDADAHRSLTREAGDRHQSAHPLRNLVDAGPLAIGSVLAEPGAAAIDEALVDRAQRLIGDAETMLDVGAVVLDHHIGAFRQTMEDRAPLRLLAVERNGPPVAVQV